MSVTEDTVVEDIDKSSTCSKVETITGIEHPPLSGKGKQEIRDPLDHRRDENDHSSNGIERIKPPSRESRNLIA